MSQRVPPSAAVEYPSFDGRPMAENDWQLHAMIDALSVLDRYFEEREEVYVSGDLLIYYEEGNPKARVAELEALLREKGGSPVSGRGDGS